MHLTCGSWHQLLTPVNFRQILPFYRSSPVSLLPQQPHCPWSLMEPNILNHFFSPHHSFTQGPQKEEEQKGDLLRCLRRLPSPFTPPDIWLWEGQSQWLFRKNMGAAPYAQSCSKGKEEKGIEYLPAPLGIAARRERPLACCWDACQVMRNSPGEEREDKGDG